MDAATGAKLHMSSQHPQACEDGRDCGNITHQEVALGADDNEVSLIVTCRWLQNKNNWGLAREIKLMHKGNHIMLSFASDAYNGRPGFGPWLAGDMLGRSMLGVQPNELPSPIVWAWWGLVQYWQPAGVIGRASLWLGDCDHDYLQGNWKYGQPGWGYGAQPPACTDQNLGEFDCIDCYVPW